MVRYPTPGKSANWTSTNTCSATFVSPRHMLTAAHCFGNDEKDEIFPTLVDFGMGTFPHNVHSSVTFSTSVKNLKIHRYLYNGLSYKPGDEFLGQTPDLAIVEFPKDMVTFWLPIRFAPLPKATVALETGYGCDRFNGQRFNDFKVAPKWVDALTSTTIAVMVDSSKNEICSGDSGAPLLVAGPKSYEVAGVTSYENPQTAFWLSRRDHMSRLDETEFSVEAWIKQTLKLP